MNQGNRIIMLIDDNEIDNFIHKHLLEYEKIGDEVIVLGTVDKALAYFASSEALVPDLILLDINLPALSGYDFLERFQSFPEAIRTSARIVVLTSSDKDEDIDQMKKNPFVKEYLVKPLDEDGLEKIKVVMNAV